MTISAAAVAVGANASSITIDGVAQRWPWNNKVDITYTVTDGQSREGGVYAGVDFTVAIPGVGTRVVHGYEIGASAETGGEGSRQHVATWTAPAGVKATECTITATLYPTNVPSGNDYMIVDIANGCKVYYEGLMASQDLSNARYNVNEYKQTKLVLRKVPKWSDANTLPNYASTLAALGGYPTGDDVNYPVINSATLRQPDKDYYIGIFGVTQAQYRRMLGTSPSNTSTETERDLKYLDLRNGESASTFAELTSNADRAAMATNVITGVSSDSGTFFQRLNYKTGLYFDLPTEVMHEIAARAGATTVYIWNSDEITGYLDYVVCNGGSGSGMAHVGQKLPNAWGLYDMCGCYPDYCLGVEAWDRLQHTGFSVNRADLGVFAPSYSKTGADWNSFPLKGAPDRTQKYSASAQRFRASDYGAAKYDYSEHTSYAAFRVSCIVK